MRCGCPAQRACRTQYGSTRALCAHTVINEDQFVNYHGAKYHSRSGFTICAEDILQADMAGYFHPVSEHADCRITDGGNCIASGHYYDNAAGHLCQSWF